MSKTNKNHNTETQEFFPFGEIKRGLKFKTIHKTKIADTITPVGLYLRFRDKYANTLLLESSDYHSKDESFTFIAIEPIVSIKAENHHLSFSHKGVELENQKIGRDFNQIFENYSKAIEIDCPAELKSLPIFLFSISTPLLEKLK
jgi:anthranilate synthase component 1